MIEVKDLTEHQIEDIRFLKETMRWPWWPLCPVYRYVSDQKHIGVVHDREGGPCVVEVYVFEYTKEEFESAPRHEYKTMTEVIQDGWMVD